MEDLKSVLRAIALIRDSAMVKEIAFTDLEERFRQVGRLHCTCHCGSNWRVLVPPNSALSMLDHCKSHCSHIFVDRFWLSTNAALDEHA